MAKTHEAVFQALKVASKASTAKQTPGAGHVIIQGEWLPVLVEGVTVARVRTRVLNAESYAGKYAPHLLISVRPEGRNLAHFTRRELGRAARWLLNTNA